MSTFTAILRDNLIVRFYKYYIIESIMIVKRDGFKTLLKERGKKVFLAIFTYYLVRDTLLYIIIPYMLARGLF